MIERLKQWKINIKTNQNGIMFLFFLFIMLWVKAIHVFGFVSWMAGMFYLPRLFDYHSMAEDKISIERFKIMERKLYNGIMMPSFILTTVMGFWMIYSYAWEVYSDMHWLKMKLFLVAILIGYFLDGLMSFQSYFWFQLLFLQLLSLFKVGHESIQLK